MQRHELAPAFQPRNLATRGPLHLLDQLDPARTVHLVIDMQNGFMRPGALLEVPDARAMVPRINAISAALRAAGGMVAFTRFAWKPDEARLWDAFYRRFLNPDRAARQQEAFAPGAPDLQLWDGLDIAAEDLVVDKTRYSANIEVSAPTPFAIPDGVYAQTVTMVEHYTDRLFRFRITRPPSFRFRSGEFVMIGLPNAERPVFRAYSIASPAWDEEIEFYSIKVADGPLTEHLQRIRIGDTVLMRRKATGTLVNDALLPGKRLYMFSTGTGIAPFASLIRDPETYEKFEQVILCHTCREVAELTYGKQLVESLTDDEIVGEMAARQLVHYTSVTRDDYPVRGRQTDLMASGRMFADLGVAPIHPDSDRGMICGSMDMLRDTKAALEAFGLVEGSNNAPGTFVVERAFVD